MMLMLTLDDAVAVCMRFLHETTYFDDMPREEYENMSEFITGEFEQKCWITSDSELAKRLPSAQPERKKGEWMLATDNNGQHFVCNHCGEWRYHQGQKFCGECGAEMER